MARWSKRCGLLVLASGMCVAQKYEPPPPPLTVDPCAAVANPLLPKDTAGKQQPACQPVPAVKTAVPGGTGTTAADQFPFPGQAAPAAKALAPEQFPYPGSTPAPASSAPAAKPADPFPYPGETSKSPDAVPEGDMPQYVPDSPAGGEKPGTAGDSSSSSSSSSGGGTGDAPDTTSGDPAGDPVGRRSHGRRALPKVSAVSPEDRASEDLDVAKFYSDRGNFQAAYLRAKDAAKLLPDDADVHFAVAQAAERLKRKDEAVAEYALYLKLDPVGDKKGAAQRALSQLR